MGGFQKSLVYPHMNPSITPAELHTLFLQWQAGQLDGRAAQRLEQWRLRSTQNEREWQQLVMLWQTVPPAQIPQGAPLEMQWANLSARIHETEAARMPIVESWTTRARRWFANVSPRPRWVFAGAALVLLVFLLRLSSFTDAPEMQTAYAPYGKRVQLTLADGSQVELNAGSSLQYPRTRFGDLRRVKLHGEAFFQVQRNDTPFEISTPHATVRVLGTAFQVRTWERATTVFVQSGKVALHSNNEGGTEAITLAAGQAARCDTMHVLSRVETSQDLLAWREGKLVFHRQPLAEVLRELQRHFNTRIQAEPALLTHTVTASFANEPVSIVLEAIAVALNARTALEAEGYWLRARHVGGRE